MSQFKCFKPSAQRLNRKRIYGFDIETCDDNKGFVCASIYYSDGQKWFFTDKKALIDFFKKPMFKHSIVAATNLGFDFFGMMFGESEEGCFRLMARGSDLLSARTFITPEGFSLRPSSTRQSLTFLNTGNYAMLSVDSIGQLLGIPKLGKPSFLGRMPGNDEEWKVLRDYNFRDSELSCEFIRFIFGAFEKLGATPKMTIASTAMSLFKNKYLKMELWQRSTEEILEVFQAYYGGRTEAFCRGRVENLKYYDFNSLYPSVMMNSFPNPASARVTRKNVLDYIRAFDGVSDVEVFCPVDMRIPLLPFRAKSKLIFPTGSFRGWYSHVELRRAIEIGYTIKRVHKTVYYKENCEPFKDYVKDLYAARMKWKGEGSPMQLVAKLLLNSLYGKFGQKFVGRTGIVHEEAMTLEMLRSPDYSRINDTKYFTAKVTGSPAVFCIPIWALYTTAYGRLKLFDALVKCEKPVYCDTDSVMAAEELPVSDRIGDLKLEMEIVHGIIVKPKMYAVTDANNEDYIKIKGIGRKLCFDEFSRIVLGKPVVLFKRFAKIRESLRRGLVPNEIMSVAKNLGLEDDKRVWPFVFNPSALQESLPVSLVEGLTSDEVLSAEGWYDKKRCEEQMEALEGSDAFDSMGKDITKEEFLENEKKNVISVFKV